MVCPIKGPTARAEAAARPTDRRSPRSGAAGAIGGRAPAGPRRPRRAAPPFV